MLTEFEKKIVSDYVDEYIDGLRMEVIYLCGSRIITEQSGSRIVVVDKDYFFIPKEIDYYETQIDLKFDRKGGFKIIDFIDEAVIDSDTVPIDDPRLSDACLSNLASHMCFDARYQQLFPEVKHMIDEFLAEDTAQELENIKKRIEPLIRVVGKE